MSQYYNWFGSMCEGKQYQRIMYADALMNGLLTKFEYTNAPDSLDTRYLELYMRAGGSAVVGRLDKTGDISAAPASLMGPIDQYNEGTEVLGVTPRGTIKGTRGEDVVFCRNNMLTRPDMFVRFYSSVLAEIQTSIRAITTYTRFIPIPLARNSKVKKLFDDCINALIKGKLETVQSDSMLRDFDGQLAELQTLNLSDVQASDKIQYLYKAVDDALRQFWLMNGQAVQGTGKMAQQSIKEVDGQTSLAYINSYNELIERRKMIDEINRIFGLDMTVELSDPWRVEIEKYKADINPEDDPSAQDEPLEEPSAEPSQEPDQEPSDDDKKEGEDDGSSKTDDK